MWCAYRHVLVAVALVICGDPVVTASRLAAQSDRDAVANEVSRRTVAFDRFFKRYAADETFAAKFTEAAQRRDYARAADLVSAATGVSQREIRVTTVEREAGGSSPASLDVDRARPALAHGPRTVAAGIYRADAATVRLQICIGTSWGFCIQW